MAPAGGRYKSKNTLAPQPNMTMTMPNGMTVHSSSSASEPWIATPISSSLRRRYFTAKNAISPAINSEKKAVTATRKK